MTRKELEAAKAVYIQLIEVIDQQIEALDAERKVWEPKGCEKYWFIKSNGFTGCVVWGPCEDDKQKLATNNCFPTRQAAERELLRRQSMKPTIPVPKVGDIYWCVSEDGATFYPCPEEWEGSDYDHNYYNLGRVFATKEECQAWIDQFGPAWTTVEDAK